MNLSLSYAVALTSFTPGNSDSIALGLPKSLISSLGGSIFLIYEASETTTSTSPTITIQVCNTTGARYGGGASGTIRVDVFKHCARAIFCLLDHSE